MSAVTTPRTGRVRAGRQALTTTPGRLRLAAVALAVGAITFGLVVATIVDTRQDAARDIATRTEPLLVSAAQLHGALSDADATATTSFITGGAEPPIRRERYLADLRAASSALVVLGRQADASTETRRAVLEIGRQLPVYAGLIETARTNNRQGFPVGAAYLREASSLMRQRILPAAARLYTVEGRRLNRSYRAGTSSRGIATLVVAAVGMLALLLLAQTYLARLTHRIFNVALVAASLVVLVLTGWALTALTVEQRALVRAQRDGSDPVEVLSGIRVLALRAQADEALALSARGSGAANLEDFAAAIKMLGIGSGPAGLLDEARAIAERHGTSAEVLQLESRFEDFQRVHHDVVALESEGQFGDAVDLSVGETGTGLSLADEITRDLDRQIAAGQRRFESAASDARSALWGLTLGIPLLTVGCALLVLYGLWLRIREYR